MQMLEETEGHAAFEQRRRSKFDKKIATGVYLGQAGLEEGVDRPVATQQQVELTRIR